MNNDSMEQARAAFFDGVAHFEAQRFVQAQTAFALALTLAPGRPSVMLNLGITQARLGQYADAVSLLAAALPAEPQSADGWTALAVAHFELSHWQQAAQACERAFALGAEPALLRRQYAKSLHRLGQFEAAIDAYQRLLAIDNTSAQAWYELGDLQREIGLLEQADHSYRQALANGADPAMVRYVRSALSSAPPILKPPRAYVQGLFDQYADDFEQHLVEGLGYCGHQVLIEQLPPNCPATFKRVLDLGCGTGLCGRLLRPRADYLAGVDLSPAMIEKARAVGAYDALSTADVHDFLSLDTSPWDLVVAADVFIYVGELSRLFELLAARLSSGGWLSFTVESAASGLGVQLLPSLRYAHSADYLRELARRHGFNVVSTQDAPIRADQGKPLMGQYWHLQLEEPAINAR